jgi:hypothetical protein
VKIIKFEIDEEILFSAPKIDFAKESIKEASQKIDSKILEILGDFSVHEIQARLKIFKLKHGKQTEYFFDGIRIMIVPDDCLSIGQDNRLDIVVKCCTKEDLREALKAKDTVNKEEDD